MRSNKTEKIGKAVSKIRKTLNEELLVQLSEIGEKSV